MAKFVIHKKVFHYDDEYYNAINEEKYGTIVKEFKKIEDAITAKRTMDIAKLRSLKEINLIELLQLDGNPLEEQQAILNIFSSFAGRKVEEEELYINDTLTDEQIQAFLDTLKVSFYSIVEYSEDATIDPNDFLLSEEESDFLTEF